MDVFDSRYRSSTQFIVATFPLLAVTFCLLYKSATRVSTPFYKLPFWGNDEYVLLEGGKYESESLILALTDVLCIFLTIFHLSCILSIHLKFFVPRRHRLLETYISEGKETIGNVVCDGKSSCKSPYIHGYLSYPHPDRGQCSVGKHVQVYENITKEGITVLFLPDAPLSGQVKDDLEVECSIISRHSNRTILLSQIASMWSFYTICCSLFVLRQISFIPDEYESDQVAWIIFSATALLTLPLAYAFDWIHWELYKRRLTSGEIILKGQIGENCSSYRPPNV